MGNSAVWAGEGKGMRERECNRFSQLTSTVTEQTHEPPRAIQGNMGAVLSGLVQVAWPQVSIEAVYSIIAIMFFF